MASSSTPACGPSSGPAVASPCPRTLQRPRTGTRTLLTRPLLCTLHPALPFLVQILVELAELQDAEVGDGTTSVVIVAAELLKRAADLARAKIHPTSIISGYRLAMREVRCAARREWGGRAAGRSLPPAGLRGGRPPRGSSGWYAAGLLHSVHPRPSTQLVPHARACAHTHSTAKALCDR